MKRTAQACLAAVAVGWLVTVYPDAAANSGRSDHVHSEPATSTEAWVKGSSFPRALYEAMARMHTEMVRTPPSGNADCDFLVMMIPHHEGAVEMARLLLISGQDPLVRRLAEEIIAGQQSEIAAMKARLAIISRSADPNPDGFPSLRGTRGQ
jgi:uncharacterized protein (DUF305 family)